MDQVCGSTRSICTCVAALFLSACGPSHFADKSHLSGHYETTEKAIPDYPTDQRVVPEYAPGYGVVISFPLLYDYEQYKLVHDILDSGVEKIWLIAPGGTKQKGSQYLAEIRSRMGERFNTFDIVARDEAWTIIRYPTEDGREVIIDYDKSELTAWSRDWAPLGARSKNGDLVLIDQNYYSHRPADDNTPTELEKHIVDAKRVSVPVHNEGGNFMLNSQGHCFMTERVVEANAEFADSEENSRKLDTDPSKERRLDKLQIVDLYKSFMGCTEVTIFPRLPHEGTGHIDMWAKLMNDNTMIVASIEEDIVQLPVYNDEQRGKVLEMQRFLNERSDEIEGMGFTVIRIPNPAPFFRSKDLAEPIYRSYTNSLIVNKHVLVPRYEKPMRKRGDADGLKYPDHHLLARFEQEVGTIYAELGYEVRWETTDNMIEHGGSVHCGTMQIGR
jgi:agmatine/peptidylarginine deiminase